MQHLGFVESTKLAKKIGSLDFNVLTNVEIINMSALPLSKNQLYDRETHQIIPYGPLDLRLGVGNKQNTCQTCFKKLVDCPGHFGYFKLALPIYHIGYFMQVLKILQSICKKCSSSLLDPEKKQMFLKKVRNPKLDSMKKISIFKKIVEESRKNKICRNPSCKAYNGQVQTQFFFDNRFMEQLYTLYIVQFSYF